MVGSSHSRWCFTGTPQLPDASPQVAEPSVGLLGLLQRRGGRWVLYVSIYIYIYVCVLALVCFYYVSILGDSGRIWNIKKQLA